MIVWVVVIYIPYHPLIYSNCFYLADRMGTAPTANIPLFGIPLSIRNVTKTPLGYTSYDTKKETDGFTEHRMCAYFFNTLGSSFRFKYIKNTLK